jgi:regulatory protein
MAVVTRLLVSGRSPRRVTVELDGEVWAELPARVVERLELAEGAEVEPAALAERVAHAELDSALDLALAYLGHRARSREEVRRRLRREGYAPEAVETALARLESAGLLDDDAYAKAYVRARLETRPAAAARLVDALAARGIPRDRARAVVERVWAEDSVSEEVLLRRAASKRARALGGLPPDVARRRLATHLLRRGFAPSAVRALVRELFPG